MKWINIKINGNVYDGICHSNNVDQFEKIGIVGNHNGINSSSLEAIIILKYFVECYQTA